MEGDIAIKKVLITSFCLGMGFVRFLDWMVLAQAMQAPICARKCVSLYTSMKECLSAGEELIRQKLVWLKDGRDVLVKSEDSVGALRAQ